MIKCSKNCIPFMSSTLPSNCYSPCVQCLYSVCKSTQNQHIELTTYRPSINKYINERMYRNAPPLELQEGFLCVREKKRGKGEQRRKYVKHKRIPVVEGCTSQMRKWCNSPKLSLIFYQPTIDVIESKEILEANMAAPSSE